MSEGLMRGPRAHSVSWTIDQTRVQGTVTCHCAVGADCRMTCLEGCESWNVVDHVHELVDNGACLFVEWMEATDGVLEAHNGPAQPLRDGFIDPDTSGDNWTWTYWDTAPLQQGEQG